MRFPDFWPLGFRTYRLSTAHLRPLRTPPIRNPPPHRSLLRRGLNLIRTGLKSKTPKTLPVYKGKAAPIKIRRPLTWNFLTRPKRLFGRLPNREFRFPAEPP